MKEELHIFIEILIKENWKSANEKLSKSNKKFTWKHGQ
jgi:hypothetical protein